MTNEKILLACALAWFTPWPAPLRADDTAMFSTLQPLRGSADSGRDCARGTLPDPVPGGSRKFAGAGQFQEGSGIYAPVALPLSHSQRGTHLNQVYAGLFRFDRDSLPRWTGDLKLYQLAESGDGEVALTDAGGAPDPVHNAATGFAAGTDGEWPRRTDGGFSHRTDGGFSHRADGGFSHRADGGFLHRADGARAAQHGDVLHSRPVAVNYNRDSSATGADDDDVVVFYGSNDGALRAVKGGQKPVAPAGTLITPHNARSYSGYEKWAFVAEEFLPAMKRLRDEHPERKRYYADGGIGVYANDADKDGKLIAGIDTVQIFVSMRRGGRLIYALDVSDPDTPRIMWTRGCASLASTERSPRQSGGCDAGYGELGQTWSLPTVAKIRYKADTGATAADKMVLIFGAGYDPRIDDQDPIPASGANSANSIGRGIYVVDLADGSVLWRAGPDPAPGTGNAPAHLTVSAMLYSVPSDIAAIDRNGDGYTDRVYVGDTGGNVWRLDLADPAPGNWTVNRLASLGFAQSANPTDRRKFLYPPVVVPSRDPVGPYDAVLIGAGDREHPFIGLADAGSPAGPAVANRFYMLKDRSVGSGWGLGARNQPVPASTIVDKGWSASAASNSDFADMTAVSATGNDTKAVDNRMGWFISLVDAGASPHALKGEKVVGSALTVAGITHFATHRPASNASGACGAGLGEARKYRVNFLNGGAAPRAGASRRPAESGRSSIHAGGGFLPSPVFVVTRPKATLPETGASIVHAVCFGIDCARVAAPPMESRVRSYWYKEFE